MLERDTVIVRVIRECKHDKLVGALAELGANQKRCKESANKERAFDEREFLTDGSLRRGQLLLAESLLLLQQLQRSELPLSYRLGSGRECHARQDELRCAGRTRW